MKQKGTWVRVRVGSFAGRAGTVVGADGDCLVVEVDGARVLLDFEEVDVIASALAMEWFG